MAFVLNKKEDMEKIYNAAQQVYEGKINKESAAKKLKKDIPASEASLKIYFNIFAYMRNGKCYKHGTSENFTKYLLDRILKDYGPDEFRLALTAAKQHAEYRSSIGNEQPGIYRACKESILENGSNIVYDDLPNYLEATTDVYSTIVSWTKFYSAFALELLKFKDDRKTLIAKIKKVYELIGFALPTLEKDNDIRDIDPFTVFGLFNKGITDDNRKKIVNGFIQVFEIAETEPENFDGIPVLNNMKATFYYFQGERGPKDIQNLWDFYETALLYSTDKSEQLQKEFIKKYNIVVSQKGVSWNITMGLFWIQPNVYINLDSRMRKGFVDGIFFPPVECEIVAKLKNLPSGSEYLEIIEICNRMFKEHPETVHDFIEMSIKAWKHDTTQESKTDPKDVSIPYEEGEKMNSNTIAKNTILYGPPGTGKTYNSACYAVAVIENKNITEVLDEAVKDYESVFKRYTDYKNDGLVEFVTFHQSYGYEEFIEGIKPVIQSEDEEKTDISYSVESGIFKKFCEKASRQVLKKQNQDIGLNKTPTIWKVSLEGTGDNMTRSECMQNGHIRIGYDSYGPDITDDTNFNEGGKNVVNALIYKMKKGDIIFSCYSASTIDAIGVVTGDYEWHDEYPHYKRLRKVNWIVKEIREDIVDINNGTQMTLSSVYKLNISLDDAMALIQKHVVTTVEEKKNHVFIIDEINRGNISKIFGELITLIEDSKRIGAKEELKVALPYSPKSKPFGVPDNIYILGTMNTADRSIAALDTALRRRFSFIEMMPEPEVLKGVIVDGIDINKMLEKINKRIEVLFDREHTIGHAYFVKLKEAPTIDVLSDIFENKIIPLLQEYFYEDYEKIRLVLGDNQVAEENKQFVSKKAVDVAALFGNDETDIIDESVFYSINTEALKNSEAYIKIYK